MNTITIQPPKGISLEDAKTALKNLKFKIIEQTDFVKIEEKDPTKMSKEEFYSKIERASKSKKSVLNIDKFKEKYGI